MIIQSMYLVLPWPSGSTPMPRKIDGSAISTIVESIETIRLAISVFDRTIQR